MSMFDDAVRLSQEIIDDVFSIEVLIEGQKVKGVFSTPSVNYHTEKASISTILQKKIFEFHEKKNGIKAKEGQKVEICGDRYTVEEVFRDSYGNAKVTLQEDYR